MASSDRPSRKFGWGVFVGVLSASAVGLIAFVVVDGDGTHRTSAPSPQPKVSSSTAAAPQSPSPDKQHGTTAVFPKTAFGEHLELGIYRIGAQQLANLGPCKLHYYDSNGAYATDCLTIERDYDKRLIFIEVALRNTGKQALEFDIEHFLLVDREGRTFDPVDVRSDFHYEPFLLSRSGLIPPHKWRVGWLTFDGRVPSLVAQSLDYVAHHETLTVNFEGHHHIETVD